MSFTWSEDKTSPVNIDSFNIRIWSAKLGSETLYKACTTTSGSLSYTGYGGSPAASVIALMNGV